MTIVTPSGFAHPGELLVNAPKGRRNAENLYYFVVRAHTMVQTAWNGGKRG